MKRVKSSRFFHVNRTSNPINRPLMQINDRIEIRDDHNSHWAPYYSDVITIGGKNPIEYYQEMAIDFENGKHVNLNLTDLEGILSHIFKIINSLVFEQIRILEFPDYPSRNKCIWVVNTKEEAKNWFTKFTDSDHRQIVELELHGVIHECDAEHLTGDITPISCIEERARKYWSGEMTNKHEQEILFVGTLTVKDCIQV